jgi:DNA polymerase III delta prime subunit
MVTGYDTEKIKLLLEEVIAQKIKGKVISRSDVTTVETDKNTISIDQIRGLIRELTMTPFGSRRVALVYGAHKLSLPAANALLKSLEEAPHYVRFVLVTEWASRLPITILSRCVRLRVGSETLVNGKETRDEAAMENLRQVHKARGLEHDDVEKIEQAVSYDLREKGPSPELKMVAMRLIDYYRIRGSGGNDKLAREVLLMHLPYN